MAKKRTLKRQKQLTWDACSKYIRKKYADSDGYVSCYTCGVVKYWTGEAMQAGHCVQGRGNSILFILDHIRVQCDSCNRWNRGRLDIFVPKLIKEIGMDRYDEILALKGKPRKWTVEELKQLEDEFKEKTSDLKD